MLAAGTFASLLLARGRAAWTHEAYNAGFSLIAHLRTCGVACTPATDSSIPAGYYLTFDDEFESLDISDQDAKPATWYTQTIQCCMYDTSSPSTPTHMGQFSAAPETNPFSLVPGEGMAIRLIRTRQGWYSGVLATVDRNGKGFSQKYGYFELRAKFPSAKGTWPAFWFLNTSALTHHAPAGEIDVVESYMAHPEYVNVTLHDWSPPARTLAHQTIRTADLTRGYHTFGLLWTESTMKFYCDGQEIFQVPTPEIMHQAYYPIVDLGLGGGWETKDTPQESRMILQYLRIYARD